jgi:cytochrome c
VNVRLVMLAAVLGCVAGGQTSAAQNSLDGAALFKAQCATCHSIHAGDPPRQGPNLAGVYDRKPGTTPDFHYSGNFKDANFVWDDAHLNAYLTNPQAVIPGSIMPYKQSKPAVREAIIAYLKDQH